MRARIIETPSQLGAVHDGGEGSISGTTPRLYERASTILAGEIQDGTLPPGVRLTETGVASRFGISRPPARQALTRLHEAGLIEKKAAGRGFFVSGEAPPNVDAPETIERQPLVSASSWERIYDEVETEIIARIAFSGWRIIEAKLARAYGVSRTVARDVVGRLQQAGLVRKDHRSHWIAPALTPEHVSELYEMRWVLEPVALTQAAPHVPATQLATMRANLEAALEKAATLTGEDLDRLENEMHVDLLRSCGNRTLLQTVRTQQSLLIAHRFLYPQTVALFPIEPFLPEHLEIVDLLQRDKVPDAARCLEQHLRVALVRALERVAEISGTYEPDPLSYLEKWDH